VGQQPVLDVGLGDPDEQLDRLQRLQVDPFLLSHPPQAGHEQSRQALAQPVDQPAGPLEIAGAEVAAVHLGGEVTQRLHDGLAGEFAQGQDGQPRLRRDTSPLLGPAAGDHDGEANVGVAGGTDVAVDIAEALAQRDGSFLGQQFGAVEQAQIRSLAPADSARYGARGRLLAAGQRSEQHGQQAIRVAAQFRWLVVQVDQPRGPLGGPAVRRTHLGTQPVKQPGLPELRRGHHKPEVRPAGVGQSIHHPVEFLTAILEQGGAAPPRRGGTMSLAGAPRSGRHPLS